MTGITSLDADHPREPSQILSAPHPHGNKAFWAMREPVSALREDSVSTQCISELAHGDSTPLAKR